MLYQEKHKIVEDVKYLEFNLKYKMKTETLDKLDIFINATTDLYLKKNKSLSK